MKMQMFLGLFLAAAVCLTSAGADVKSSKPVDVAVCYFGNYHVRAVLPQSLDGMGFLPAHGSDLRLDAIRRQSVRQRDREQHAREFPLDDLVW